MLEAGFRLSKVKRVRILVSNDDGVFAEGIQALAASLCRRAENSVYIVAPDRERSATGHALTLHKPIRVEEAELDIPGLKGSWWTTGTPSDCVKFAVGTLLAERPDLVVSGINSGPNLGSEILYSGTVSAAMEGAILNIPSIAVSLVGRSVKHWEVAAEFIAGLVQIIPAIALSPRTLLNVNVPNLPASEIKGVRLTEVGLREYDDHYERRTDPRGREYYWLAGEAREDDEPEESDAWAVKHKYISVTPITFNMTDRATLARLAAFTGPTGLSFPGSFSFGGKAAGATDSVGKDIL